MSNKIKNGDMPAMPIPNDATGRPYVVTHEGDLRTGRAIGLTKREQFALKIACALIVAEPH